MSKRKQWKHFKSEWCCLSLFNNKIRLRVIFAFNLSHVDIICIGGELRNSIAIMFLGFTFSLAWGSEDNIV